MMWDRPEASEAGTASIRGAAVEIRPFDYLSSNSLMRGHCLVGKFDWGGRLQKRNRGF